MMHTTLFLARGQPRRAGRQVGEPIVVDLAGDGRRLNATRATLKTPRYPETEQVTLAAASRFAALAERIIAAAEAQTDAGRARADDLRRAADGARTAFDAQDLSAADGQVRAFRQLALTNPSPGAGDPDELRSSLTAPGETELRELFARRIRYEAANEAGVYQLQLEAPGQNARTLFFARNPDPAEGDLTLGGEEALAQALDSRQFVYVRRSGPERQDAPGALAGKDLWRWAIGAMLAMLAAEIFLAQRFGHYTKTRNRAPR